MALVFELCNLRPGIAKVEHSVTGWLGYGSMPTRSWPGADIRTCFCFQFSKAGAAAFPLAAQQRSQELT